MKLDPDRQVSIGGQPRIDLRFLGQICGMDLFIDLGGQLHKEEQFKLALAYMYNAFIVPKRESKDEPEQ